MIHEYIKIEAVAVGDFEKKSGLQQLFLFEHTVVNVQWRFILALGGLLVRWAFGE